MDRYYCTVNIFLNLKKLDIRATGTIIQNRKNLPKQYLSNINLQRYESTIFTYDNSIKILIWKNKKMYIQQLYDGYNIIKEKLNFETMKKYKFAIPYLIE